MSDPIERQEAIDAINDLPDCPNGFSDTYDKSCIIGVLEELPSADPSIPISWIEKYIDWLNGLESPFSTVTALQVSLMVKRWKGDCPLPVNFFPDGKRKEDSNG